MEPMINVTYTTDQHNRLLSRRVHNMVGTRFQNGAFLNVIYNRRSSGSTYRFASSAA